MVVDEDTVRVGLRDVDVRCCSLHIRHARHHGLKVLLSRAQMVRQLLLLIIAHIVARSAIGDCSSRQVALRLDRSVQLVVCLLRRGTLVLVWAELGVADVPAADVRANISKNMLCFVFF